MNTPTPTSFAQSPGFAGRVMLRVRQWLWWARPTIEQPTSGRINTHVEGPMASAMRRIQAITASGHQSAGQFGRGADPVNVVRISVTNRFVGTPKTGSGQVRPGLAHAAGKTSSRVVIIR